MRTQTENKQALLNYLEKTAKHTFITESGVLYAVREKNGIYYRIEGTRINELAVDDLVNWYKENAKNVMTHTLFLNRGLKSIKRNPEVREWLATMLK